MAQGSSTQSLEVFGRAVLALDKCSRVACGSRESLSRTLPKILIGEGPALVRVPQKSEYDEKAPSPLDACQAGLSQATSDVAAVPEANYRLDRKRVEKRKVLGRQRGMK